MIRILCCTGLISVLALPLAVQAQYSAPPAPSTTRYGVHDRFLNDHAEFGAYGDMFRVKPVGGSAVNFLGLGARVGFNMHPNVALEAEMNYNFAQNYTTVSTNGNTTGVTSTTITGKTRPLTGLFGPKFQFGTSGSFRAFVTGKVGFTEFSQYSGSASGTSFDNAFDQFGGGTTHIAVYPGGGIESFFGPIGLRLEAGDQVYFNNGAYNNLRINFGPIIRF